MVFLSLTSSDETFLYSVWVRTSLSSRVFLIGNGHSILKRSLYKPIQKPFNRDHLFQCRTGEKKTTQPFSLDKAFDVVDEADDAHDHQELNTAAEEGRRVVAELPLSWTFSKGRLH